MKAGLQNSTCCFKSFQVKNTQEKDISPHINECSDLQSYFVHLALIISLKALQWSLLDKPLEAWEVK